MKNYKTKTKQRGVALAIGIILLLIIAVIGVTSMKSALLQERMSGGMKNREYADAAAYSLLVSVENYLFSLYETNNGTEAPLCDYCQADARSPEWQSFHTQKHMLDGDIFPGTSNLLSFVLPFVGDEPRYVLYPMEGSLTGAGGGVSSEDGHIGEFDEESSGASAGSAGDSGGTVSEYEIYRVAAKANDIRRHLYVVYESFFAVVQN